MRHIAELRKRDYVVIAIAGLVCWYLISIEGPDKIVPLFLVAVLWLCATLEAQIRGLKKDLEAHDARYFSDKEDDDESTEIEDALNDHQRAIRNLAAATKHLIRRDRGWTPEDEDRLEFALNECELAVILGDDVDAPSKFTLLKTVQIINEVKKRPPLGRMMPMTLIELVLIIIVVGLAVIAVVILYAAGNVITQIQGAMAILSAGHMKVSKTIAEGLGHSNDILSEGE